MTARTLYDKLWDEHVVHTEDDGTATLYIDRHLVHEVTSPQAFEGLELAGRKVWRLSANLAVSDHNVPTTDRSQGIADPISKLQVDTLDKNCDRVGITQFKMNDKRQGIVHVIGPEQGATLPGMTWPSTLISMFLAFLASRVWVASTCSTSEVPMPCASAPKAPWVEVWLSPQTTVMPGSVAPFSGPTTWTMPWRRLMNGK